MPDATPSALLRLFIALPVPAKKREVIARAQGQLKRAAPPGLIRWTRAEQFHLTLKFLGDIPATQVEALKVAVDEVCAGFSPMILSAGGIGFFPDERKPRVLWAGAADAGEQLAEVHRRIHAAVRPFAPADRSERFAAHITLGRFN
jgi:2'-5' RNA ligase